jgi:3'-5' exoribonuclease
MKSTFVEQLQPEQTVTSFFLVVAKETRTGKSSGKPYLELELCDRTGAISARVFENVERAAESFRADEVVKIKGRVQIYNGRKQLVVDQIRPAKDEEFELADFLPHTQRDIEELYARLQTMVAEVANPWLRRLLQSVVNDEEIAPRLKRAPAGKYMHHAFIGGLLEHVVSLCELCRRVAPHYPEIDGDLLFTGAVLHDLGKVYELRYERAFEYSTEGMLLGHIVIELEFVSRKMDAIEGFPPNLKTIVKHLIASHHGQHEFGSPVLPKCPEAVMLHYLDDLDSKMGAMRATLAEPGEGEWSSKNPSLGRPLLRLDRFRDDLAPGADSGPTDAGKS